MRRLVGSAVLAVCLAFAGVEVARAEEPSGPVGPHAEALDRVVWTNRPGPQTVEEGRIRRQFWQVPSPVAGQVPLKATVYRPKGDGPHPLAILLHGGTNDAAERHKWSVPHFFDLAVMLVDRGYVVIAPQRRNYGDDPNPFAEDNAACSVADYRRVLQATAEDALATVAFMRQQPFVDRTRLLVVGHSAGGAGALAVGAAAPDGLRGIVNFAGGKGATPTGNWRKNCKPENLIEVVGALGAKTTVPSLWIYAENDLWIPPEMARLMFAAHNAGSKGRDRFVQTAPFGADGHAIVLQRAAIELWRKDLLDFLAMLNGP